MSDVDYLKKYLDPSKLEEGLKKLESGIPVQYIVGNVIFYGYKISVNENVLIPRFETEGLVEKTIQYLRGKDNIDIVDVCTGSGCIAISLKHELNCNVDAVDISISALEVAALNAKGLDINFYLGNLLEPLNKKYDVIISNPPYIAYDESIMDIVKNNEPSIALYADNDGLYFYEEILKNCKNYLKDKFLIAFEIGSTQASRIEEIANKYLKNIDISIEQDLAGFDRYVFIRGE